MQHKRIIIPALGVLLVVAIALVCGCGDTGTDLSYSNSGTTPVVTFNRYQAIAPIYNSSAPVTIIYGDGKATQKKGPYEFTTGSLTGDGLSGVLQSLSEEGFFELEGEYSGKPMPGGVTEVLVVRLSDKTYEISVQSGQGPPNWEKIVSTVTDLETSGPQEYIPDTILLFVKAEPGAPSAPNVMTWPGDSEDLARASSAESNGVKLEGEEASVAWKAVQESMKGETEVTWKANGGFYTYVYAVPVFPGIPEQR